MTEIEAAFLRAVRAVDERRVEELRGQLRDEGYTIEEIRDLWEIFGVSVADKVARYRMASAREWCAAQDAQGTSKA